MNPIQTMQRQRACGYEASSGTILGETDARAEMFARAERWCQSQTGMGVAYWVHWLAHQGNLDTPTPACPELVDTPWRPWLDALIQDLDAAHLPEVAQTLRLLRDAVGSGGTDL